MRQATVLLCALALASAAAAATGQPKRALRPADQRAARAIVVRAGDLPGSGWHTTPSRQGGTGAAASPRCPGAGAVSRLTMTGEWSGPSLDRAATAVASSTALFADAGQAATFFRLMRNVFLSPCVVASIKEKGVHVESARALVAPAVAARSARLRLVLRYPRGRESFDYVLLQRGRAATFVVFFRFPGGTVPATLERAVAAKVAARMNIP